MRHLPKFKYSGLTIVLSNPSRFDNTKKTLLSGYAGIYFNDECLRPSINRYQCDIRTADTIVEGLLPDTKVVLLLGDYAFQTWTSSERYKDNTLHEQRGYLLDGLQVPSNNSRNAGEIFTLCSYFPQDCMDVKDFEKEHNPLSEAAYEESTFKDADEVNEKRRTKTLRQNYRFWLKEDVKKAVWFLTHSKDEINQAPSTRLSQYKIYPSSDEAYEQLKSNKGKRLFLDIETDIDYNITCFSYAFTLDCIYTVPVYRCDYSLAYSKEGLFKIIQGLVIAMRDNTIVCHNAMFDLMILAVKYKLPIGRKIYDTMLAHHRCWPEIEKSLGHAISHLCKLESFHKNDGVFQPHNIEQEKQLWQYNARDVSSMILVHNALEEYSQTIPGLKASIDQANNMVYPYLVASIQGIYFDEDRRKLILIENDRLMTQYLRCIKILTGSPILPTSNKQCTAYFQDAMGYKPTNRTPTGNPSWNELGLRKLKLKIDNNPVIDFCLKFRTLSKESGTLKFREWERRLEKED